MGSSEPRDYLLDRRTLLTDFGRGVLGLALLSPAAVLGAPAAQGAPAPEPVRYARANLGFVSAYVLARGREAMIVDTGTSGSTATIAKAVKSLGLGWANVRHIVLTHHHGDHAGSLAEVMKATRNAKAYAGAADISRIRAPRALRAVKDGDEVFGLRIVATPGHTAGHVCVFDPVGGLLVSGDAAGSSGGAPVGPNPGFSSDIAEANRSLAKLSKERFEVMLPGHGEPITAGASASLAKLIG